MRRDVAPRSAGWNQKVSQFVTALIQNSASNQQLSQFLSNPPPDLGALISEENGVWVVKLPGWDQPK